MVTKPQKFLRVFAGVLVVLGVIGFVRHGPLKFQRNFVGMSEAEVRSRLGDPFSDSRRSGGDGRSYTLGWHQGRSTPFELNFKDGAVTSRRSPAARN